MKDSICRLGTVLLLGMTLSAGRVAHAGGLYLEEFATPSMGTAGAGAEARAADGSTALHNPAGMTRLEGHQLTVGIAPGFTTVKFDKDSDTPKGGGNGGEQGGFVPMASGAYSHKLHDKVRLGISLYSPGGAALNPSNDWAGRNTVTEISLTTFAANPSLAIEVADGISLAGGPLLVYGLLDWKLEGPLGGNLHYKNADDFNAGGFAAALLEPLDNFRIGVTWTSKVELHLKGNLKNRLASGFEPRIEADLPMPQSIRTAAWWDVCDELSLMGSFAWEDWSEMKDLPVSTDRGSVDADLGFKDVLRFGVGMHYRLDSPWTLQAGYAYDTSAVNKGHRITSLPVDDQHRLAFGALYDWSDSTRLGFSFEWVHLGNAPVDSKNAKGDYSRNEMFLFGLSLNWKTDSWRRTLGLDET